MYYSYHAYTIQFCSAQRIEHYCYIMSYNSVTLSNCTSPNITLFYLSSFIQSHVCVIHNPQLFMYCFQYCPFSCVFFLLYYACSALLFLYVDNCIIFEQFSSFFNWVYTMYMHFLLPLCSFCMSFLMDSAILYHVHC